MFDRIDIWDEPAAAAWVRTVADGNETVPTVRVAGAGAGAGAGRAVALVNPSATEVLDQLARRSRRIGCPRLHVHHQMRQRQVRRRRDGWLGWLLDCALASEVVGIETVGAQRRGDVTR